MMHVFRKDTSPDFFLLVYQWNVVVDTFLLGLFPGIFVDMNNDLKKHLIIYQNERQYYCCCSFPGVKTFLYICNQHRCKTKPFFISINVYTFKIFNDSCHYVKQMKVWRKIYFWYDQGHWIGLDVLVMKRLSVVER